MLSLPDENCCTGCSACAENCPNNALKLDFSMQGFWRPKPKTEACIKCGICERTCPLLNSPRKHQLLQCYKGRNIDPEILKISSSGGIFHALAAHCLDNGGVVCAAKFSDPYTVAHAFCKSKDELPLFCGSKYVQSLLPENLFRTIKKILKSGQQVLFAGTPCQVGGLLNMLGRPFENLITVDFICHGVASPKLLKMFLHSLEQKYHSSIKSVEFRNKEQGYSKAQFVVQFANNSKFVSPSYRNNYTYGFAANISTGESCFACSFVGEQRISDITLGDCLWEGISNEERQSGVSLILENTPKGKQYLTALSGIQLSPLTLEEVHVISYRLNGKSNLHPLAGAFQKSVQENVSWEDLCKKYLQIPWSLRLSETFPIFRYLFAAKHLVQRTFWGRSDSGK